jgi:3-hydroxyacyl-CoA dehydrogenase/enoyl-CoA hydratase/3-hydroxybutyryl-CoA epimerase
MSNIQRQLHADGVCVLTFDRAESSANIFDRTTLAELTEHLTFIEKPDSGVKGLILTSAKDAIFVAGADLYSVRKMNAEELKEFITAGQDAFTRIAHLSIPSVAAIHGVAVGGGCEVTLACDWRVASPDPATKIGLPETQLGILPAWGGCTRLPKLLGVPKALDIILGGKTLAAKHALKAGLIDELASREYLLRAARELLGRGKRSHDLLHSAPVNAVVDAVIASKVRKATAAKTHGHYPAIEKAQEVVMQCAKDWREADSLAREREAIGELIASDSTRQLLNLFFLQERAKKLTAGARTASSASKGATADEAVRAPRSVAVIGAGIMGSGIAQWLSTRGIRVLLRDVDAARVAAGMGHVAKLYAAGVKRRVFSEREARRGMELISPAPSEVPMQGVDMVIEAAVEKMEIKKTIFRRLDELVREDCVLATNTSALSISELASATKHPARVVGIHFFNPVHRMQLVEVVTGKDTAPEVAQRALRLVQKIGKLPVLVKDSPGFLVNRILLPYMIEAGTLFAQGASAAAIDGAMIDFGMPMGPLALCDEVGIDIADDVAQTLAAAFPGWMRVPEILPKLIAAGLLGKKAGKGFYVHKQDEDPVENPEVATMRSGGSAATLDADALKNRMVLLMVNEAARCLEEGIAAEPADVDFAMVMGTGWAPFRGGPLRHADRLGAAHAATQLTRLSETVGPHFAPCARLADTVKHPRRFYEE